MYTFKKKQETLTLKVGIKLSKDVAIFTERVEKSPLKAPKMKKQMEKTENWIKIEK